MKIILKTIVGKETAKEVEPDIKVEDIKKLFEDDYVLNTLQVCFKGAILENTKTLAESGVGENSVVIITGKKIKNQKLLPKKTTETSQSLCMGTGAVKEDHAETNKSSNVPSASTEGLSTNAVPLQQQQQQQPAIATHGIDPSLIDSIVAMGFEDRQQVVLALRAAQSNVERAVEFLCAGIPDSALFWLRESDSNINAATEEGPLRLLDTQTSRAANVSLLQQALMNIPQFEEIRAIVQSNPQSLSTVIQQLRMHHPDVIELIQQNPNEFMELILGQEQMGLSTSGDDGFDGRPNVIEIAVEEEERIVIQRLVELGGGTWNEQDALQAYRACEGDEEAAAHFLLSNYFGDNS